MWIANLSLYFAYYCTMKIIWGEPMLKCSNWVVHFLIIVTLSFWIPALKYFGHKAKRTEYTPAESRNINEPCELSIFDKHDLWHFLSAAGLFTNYLIILVIDDDISHEAREEILPKRKF